MDYTKTNILEGFFWKFFERCGAQFVSLIVSIALARILLPSDYGLIALVTVFTNILQVFVDSGLGTALIQKKDADDLDFSSVFYFNVVVCCVLYVAMFFLAPLIATLYSDERLIGIIRIISLTILISGLKGIQQAYVSKHMLFKRFFFSTLGGTLFSAFIGIAMAYAGFGVWSLVVQQLSNSTIDTLILWLTVKWHPRKMFSWKRLKNLLSYGWKLLCSSLIDTVYNNLTNLIIGKKYSASDLAFYNQGDKFPQLIITNINTSIDSVLLPTMSSVQEKCDRVKSMTRRAIKTSTYIMAPLMVGLAFCAPSVVTLLLTKKWLPCVPFLRIFCITYIFWPIHTANLNAIKALGKSGLFLKLEIIKKAVGVIFLCITMNISVMAMAYSLIMTSILNQIINSWPNKKLLNYGYLEQLKDIFPSIILSVVMGIIIGILNYTNWNTIIVLGCQIFGGALIYLIGSIFFKLDSYQYLMSILKKKVKRDNSNE